MVQSLSVLCLEDWESCTLLVPLISQIKKQRAGLVYLIYLTDMLNLPSSYCFSLTSLSNYKVWSGSALTLT